MIKYFSFEQYYKDGKVITENEKVLDEKPETYEYGYEKISIGDSMYIYYIDVENYIKWYGCLNKNLQKIYDKLVLEQRNLKLETL